MRDFLEMNMYLEDLGDDESVDLWITCRDRKMLHFENVRGNPVRYEGSWMICHDFVGQRATSYIPAEDVWYFTIVNVETERVPAMVTTPNNDLDNEALEDIYRAESTLMNGIPEVEDTNGNEQA